MLIKFLLFSILSFSILSNIILAENYNLNIVEYPEEIIAEVGWVKYFNIILMNKGDQSLSNVSIYFNGEFPQWFDIQTNATSILQPNSNTSFLVKLNLPSNVGSRTYSFSIFATSKEISDSRTFTVRVFQSKSEMMFFQIQQLEIESEDIEINITKAESIGKNVTDIKNTLNEVKDNLENARSFINRGEYERSTQSMINAENLMKKAIFDLSLAQVSKTENSNSTPFPIEWIMVPVVIAIGATSTFFLLKRRKKQTLIKAPVVKIKEIVLEGKNVKNLENELKGNENSKNLLEEEFRENLISQESYEELKTKYERKIAELKSEIERNKII